jgi:hypothetical protein
MSKVCKQPFHPDSAEGTLTARNWWNTAACICRLLFKADCFLLVMATPFREMGKWRDRHWPVPSSWSRLSFISTPAGWLTFGFHEDVNEAWAIATHEMVRLMGELYQLKPKEALALASLVMDLRITQVVNGVRGVHALLPHDAIEQRQGVP